MHAGWRSCQGGVYICVSRRTIHISIWKIWEDNPRAKKCEILKIVLNEVSSKSVLEKNSEKGLWQLRRIKLCSLAQSLDKLLAHFLELWIADQNSSRILQPSAFVHIREIKSGFNYEDYRPNLPNFKFETQPTSHCLRLK